MNKLFLIGYMGAGKTTIGKYLAKCLKWQFTDTDRFIEERYNMSVSEIFAEKGESFFREIEQEILHEIVQFENMVIATGGGTPCFFDNMDLMNQCGTTVYLKVPVNELTEHLDSGRWKRPLIKDMNLEELQQFIGLNLGKREVWYNRATIIFPLEKCKTKECFDQRVKELIKRL